MGLISEFISEFKENLRLRKDKEYAKQRDDALLEYNIKAVTGYQAPTPDYNINKEAVNAKPSPKKTDWFEAPPSLERPAVENGRFVKLNSNGTVDIVNHKGYYWTRLPCSDAVSADSSGMTGKVVRKDGTIDYYDLSTGALRSRDVSNRR